MLFLLLLRNFTTEKRLGINAQTICFGVKLDLKLPSRTGIKVNSTKLACGHEVGVDTTAAL